MRGHVDPETLAAFREELLPGRRTRWIAAHLAHCAQCAGLDAQLAGLPALLASTPAPPMPDALTARIEAAIAAEAAARSATSPEGAVGAKLAAAGAGAAAHPGSAAPSADAARGRRRRAPVPDRSRLALRIAAAAAAVVVIGGGGYGVSRLFSSPAPLATASGAPSAGGEPRPAPAQRQGTGRMGTLSPAKLALPSHAASAPVVDSGTNYLPGRLTAQVVAELAKAGNAAPSPGGAAGLTPLKGDISGCLRRVTGGQRPLLVDRARYQGKPATIVVLPTGRPQTLQALVAGPGCSATATDLLASTTFPRPR